MKKLLLFSLLYMSHGYGMRVVKAARAIMAPTVGPGAYYYYRERRRQEYEYRPFVQGTVFGATIPFSVFMIPAYMFERIGGWVDHRNDLFDKPRTVRFLVGFLCI